MFVAVRVCYIGERLIDKNKAWNQEKNMWECSKENTTRLYYLYCKNLTADLDTTDPDCIYFRSNPVGLRRGIPGLPSGVFYSKLLHVILSVSCYVIFNFLVAVFLPSPYSLT